jgi:hypothetical protein
VQSQLWFGSASGLGAPLSLCDAIVGCPGPLGGAGDLNGDGFDDLIAGLRSGHALAYRGRSLFSAIPAWVEITGPVGVFGAAAGVGDVDGDGRDDVMVLFEIVGSENAFVFHGL